MMTEDLSEAALRAVWEAGDRTELVTRVIRGYGREVLSYLLATLRGEGEAGDAFSQFTLNLWEASGAFRGDASFRTWAYSLARHAAGRVIRERGRQRRQVALSSVPEIDGLCAKVRSETLEYLRTATRDRVTRLRDELEPDDQMLLILRVDRGFPWPDIARVMSDDEAPSQDLLARKIVSLRKRFERIKDRIRKRAAEM
jgi:RNA polymerase sigma-70 factor (ECF subfamily)